MSLFERFLAFEKDHKTFNIEIKNVLIWERIRFGVFRELKEESGSGQAHTSIDLNSTNKFNGAKLWLKNLVSKNPYLAPPSDVLFVGHQRRKKEADGYWWDIYCDPLHEQCSFNSVHFEFPYLLDHRSPAKTDSLRYLEFIEYSGTILRKLGYANVEFDAEEISRLEKLEEALQYKFDVSIDIKSKVRRILQNRDCRLPLYKQLLDRVNPKIAVVVVSYGKETFIEACKNREIPVVELQHGTIYSNHFGYSFAGERTKKAFPDYLLTWGEFWGNGVEFPIPAERVIPTGYPYLESSINSYDTIDTKHQILFISQGTIGEQLSKFAMQIDKHPDIDHNIIYKLHPGEYHRWQDKYPWLLDAEFKVVDSTEPPLYELFAESSVQVGVYSTAVYEGLAFDLETYVYDCSGSDVLEPLIQDGSAELISSVDEIASTLGTEKNQFQSNYYFASNAIKKSCDTIERLADQGTQYS